MLWKNNILENNQLQEPTGLKSILSSILSKMCIRIFFLQCICYALFMFDVVYLMYFYSRFLLLIGNKKKSRIIKNVKKIKKKPSVKRQ